MCCVLRRAWGRLDRVRGKRKTRHYAGFGGGRWIRTTEVVRQQIYSLLPLATRESLHMSGAGGRNRTPDLLITNQLLYLLSYTSIYGDPEGARTLDL